MSYTRKARRRRIVMLDDKAGPVPVAEVARRLQVDDTKESKRRETARLNREAVRP